MRAETPAKRGAHRGWWMVATTVRPPLASFHLWATPAVKFRINHETGWHDHACETCQVSQLDKAQG